MWCIPNITPEFIERMENVLDLYEKPYDVKEPMLCIDEKSKQLIEDTRSVQQAKEHRLLTRPSNTRRLTLDFSLSKEILL